MTTITLAQYLIENKEMPLQERLFLIKKIIEGLQKWHSKKYYFGLCLENILYDGEKIDFATGRAIHNNENTLQLFKFRTDDLNNINNLEENLEFLQESEAYALYGVMGALLAKLDENQYDYSEHAFFENKKENILNDYNYDKLSDHYSNNDKDHINKISKALENQIDVFDPFDNSFFGKDNYESILKTVDKAYQQIEKEVIIDPNNVTKDQQKDFILLLEHLSKFNIDKMTKSKGISDKTKKERDKPGIMVNGKMYHLKNHSLVLHRDSNSNKKTFHVIDSLSGEGSSAKVKYLKNFYELQKNESGKNNLISGQDDSRSLKIFRERDKIGDPRKKPMDKKRVENELKIEIKAYKSYDKPISTFQKENTTGKQRTYAFIPTAKGVSLDSFFQNVKNINLSERLDIIKQIIIKLEDLHKKGGYYTDLKPENIFYDQKTKTITLVDLASIAKIDEKSTSTPLFSHDTCETNPEIEVYALKGVIGVVLSKHDGINEYDDLPFMTSKNVNCLTNDYEMTKISDGYAAPDKAIIDKVINIDFSNLDYNEFLKKIDAEKLILETNESTQEIDDLTIQNVSKSESNSDTSSTIVDNLPKVHSSSNSSNSSSSSSSSVLSSEGSPPLREVPKREEDVQLRRPNRGKIHTTKDDMNTKGVGAIPQAPTKKPPPPPSSSPTEKLPFPEPRKTNKFG